MRTAYRLQTPLLLVAPILAALLAAVAVTKGGTVLLAAAGLAALALAVVGLSVRPVHLFLLWLLAAPFLQDVGTGRLEHVMRIVLFSSPPLLFAFWALLERRTVRGSAVDVLPAAYLLLVVGSASLVGVSVSPTQLFSIVAIGVIVYYFCAFGSVGDDLEQKAARVVLLTGFVVSLVVVGGRLAGFRFGALNDQSANVTRAGGPFGDPAYLGTFIGASFVLGLAVLVWGRPASLQRLALLAALSAPPALFLTLTRGPLIAAGSVGLLVALSRGRSRWPGILAVVLICLVVAGLWGAISSTSLYKDRFSNQSNVDARLLIDRWSFELAGRKPVLGWGYGSFDRVKNSSNLSSGSVPRAVGLEYTSHNTFLTILVELGGVGLILLLVPWLVTVRSSIRLARDLPSEGWAVVGLLGILAVWVVNAGTVDMRFFPFAWVLPWLAIGLLRRRVLDVEQLDTSRAGAV